MSTPELLATILIAAGIVSLLICRAKKRMYVDRLGRLVRLTPMEDNDSDIRYFMRIRSAIMSCKCDKDLFPASDMLTEFKKRYGKGEMYERLRNEYHAKCVEFHLK